MVKSEIETFEIGVTVALKSGGPGLTVLGQAGERVHCVFFSDELGEFRETMLPAVALERIDIADAGDEDDDSNADEEDGDEDEEDDENAKTS